MIAYRIASTDTRLGRHVRHDPRSRAFAFPESGAALVSVHWNRFVPVWDQGQLGSCTGNAALGCAGTGRYFPPASVVETSWTEADAVSVYSAATLLDGDPDHYPPTDTGSDGLSVAKVLKARGLISGYQHAFSLAACLSALQQGPVIVGTEWYQSMFTPSAEGQLNVDASSGVAGGHEYILDQYEAATRRVWMQNSWGAGWSIGGRAWMTSADLGHLLASDGDCTVFVPATSPAPVPTPVPPAPAPEPSGFDQVIAGLRRVWADLDRWLKAHGL